MVNSVRRHHGTALWESRRLQCIGEYFGKCALTALFIVPVKIISLGLIPSPFNYTRYWDPYVAQKIAIKLKYSTIAEIINDTSLSASDMYNQVYTINGLVRYGFIGQKHANKLRFFIAHYKALKKVSDQYYEKFSDLIVLREIFQELGRYTSKMEKDFLFLKPYDATMKKLLAIEFKWLRYKNKFVVPRLPHPLF